MATFNRNLQKLFDVAQKPERLVIGLMSGTSLDGLDIALCRFTSSGFDTKFELLHFTTIPYPENFKDDIRQVFAKRQADMEKLCLLNAKVGTYHAELIIQALDSWRVDAASVDLIASHGQTVYHAPSRLHGHLGYPNATLQIGDADHISIKTGIITLSDFRQKHIAAGGEGAPLALYGDVLLGSKQGENRILLNIGGIANLTWLPAEKSETVLCTDIGPGNTLIDAACKKYFDKPYDEDSRIGFSGTVNNELLSPLLNHPFFNESLPKTTGPELFNLAYVERAQEAAGVQNIEPNDLIATLSAFTAKSIADFVKQHCIGDDIKLFTSGGGARNPHVIKQLENELSGTSIQSSDAIGINPDAKEAILFALLANEAIVGEPLQIGNNPTVLMGKFSFPA
ncbi:anhydro-N-acetylmuramic acid kinase [Mucilaginibacter limnophilus]|uniref:Anhydro-N-acetylmuramic acid kinase n=1 Tax=Mucilaginibacter limnophilus TaxID=1932778 RepID=A0A437MVR9_9SPHI|nr:anhydro-N-acetylmuramic acid kinase [Mucilaginibacter limnophilus]RVU01733.1 anhydro-N-acetylmuramic acid kinase [Mucilaginibacter limnophilus]